MKPLLLITSVALALVGSACFPPTSPPAGFARIRASLDPGPAEGRYVEESSGDGRSGSALATMACKGLGGGDEHCVLDYCTQPREATNTQLACAAPPVNGDGKYHHTFVAHLAPGDTFMGWTIIMLGGARPTLSDLNSPTLDVSWPAGADGLEMEISAGYRAQSNTTPTHGVPLGCPAPVTTLEDPGPSHPQDVVVVCGDILLAKRSGVGATKLVTAAAKVAASDDEWIYYDDAQGLRRVPVTGGTPQTVVAVVPGPVRWIGTSGKYVYYVAGTETSSALFSAQKDGTPYPSDHSNVMYKETNVIAADVDGPQVLFAYQSTTDVNFATVPLDADLSAIPQVVATGMAPVRRLRHTDTLTYWGGFYMLKPVGTTRRVVFAQPTTTLDSMISDLYGYVPVDTCVRAYPLDRMHISTIIGCGATPVAGIFVDDTRAYWTRDGALESAPK